jgi:predicted nucleic acid-binding protein
VILADTSIWIDFINGKITPETNILDKALADGNVIIGDLILLEVLQGIRNDNEYKKTLKALETLDSFELFGKTMVLDCAENFRKLRKKGQTIRKTADLIIATFCIKNKIPLLYSDRGFIPFSEYLGLVSVSSQI